MPVFWTDLEVFKSNVLLYGYRCLNVVNRVGVIEKRGKVAIAISLCQSPPPTTPPFLGKNTLFFFLIEQVFIDCTARHQGSKIRHTLLTQGAQYKQVTLQCWLAFLFLCWMYNLLVLLLHSCSLIQMKTVFVVTPFLPKPKPVQINFEDLDFLVSNFSFLKKSFSRQGFSV